MTEIEQARSEAMAVLHQVSNILQQLGGPKKMRRKQLIGGEFSKGNYWICSTPVDMRGLDGVMYFVFEGKSEFVVGSALDRNKAVSLARSMLLHAEPLQLQLTIARFTDALEVVRKAELARRKAEQEEWERLQPTRRSATVRSIPRRRRQIFEASEGKCHYCSTALTLDGKWHIEHKMPKALGGDNTPGNLVASCAPCNHEKRDTTEQEFRAKRAGKAAA